MYHALKRLDSGESKCPVQVLEAIYKPKLPTKSAELEEAQQRWWRAYSDRKMNVPEEEYTANAMVYDPNHLPNSPRAPTSNTHTAAPSAGASEQ